MPNATTTTIDSLHMRNEVVKSCYCPQSLVDLAVFLQAEVKFMAGASLLTAILVHAYARRAGVPSPSKPYLCYIALQVKRTARRTCIISAIVSFRLSSYVFAARYRHRAQCAFTCELGDADAARASNYHIFSKISCHSSERPERKHKLCIRQGQLI